MKEFLEHLIPKLMYFQLFFILITIIYMVYKRKNTIFNDIKYNKLIYLFLIIIFFAGFYIRLHPTNIFALNGDVYEYNIQAAEVVIDGKFSYINDPPAFSNLISIVQKIVGFGNLTGVFTNIIFGSLSIILIFIMMRLLFKSALIGLVSSALLSFSSLHYMISIDGYPFASSIFFIFLSIILLKLAVNNNTLLTYIGLALSLGYTVQFYYIELILIFPVLLYIIIKFGFRKLPYGKLLIFFLFFIISIIPFIILQHITPEKYPDSFAQKDDSITCFWNKHNCAYSFWPQYLFRLGEHAKTDITFEINGIKGNFPSYLSYLYLGMGRRSRTFQSIFVDYEKEDMKQRDWIYILYILLTFASLIIKRTKPELVLLFVLLFSFLLMLSMFFSQIYLYAAYIEVVGVITISSVGLIVLTERLFKRKFYTLIVVGLVLILLLMPFFQEENIKISDNNFIQSQLTTNYDFWQQEECGSPFKELEDVCSKVALTFIDSEEELT